jgi:hypothetical protein
MYYQQDGVTYVWSGTGFRQVATDSAVDDEESSDNGADTEGDE